jgi:hypothetical protein
MYQIDFHTTLLDMDMNILFSSLPLIAWLDLRLGMNSHVQKYYHRH